MPNLSTPQDRTTALLSSAWFRGRPDALRAWICENSRPLALAAGQRLFDQGEPTKGVYFVVEGTIRIMTSVADGRHSLLALAAPPMWFGETGLFDGEPHSHDASAESDALLLHIGQLPMLEHLALHPSHWQSFGLLLAQKLRLAFHGIEEASLLSPSTRLARRLLAMAGSYGEWKDRSKMVIEVQQDQLGSMLSLSRQTVNAILKEFELRGFVRRARGAIEIIDFAGFKSFSAPE